jgi:two-component system response regulator
MINHKKHILLVEDNPDECELIQLAFKEVSVPHEFSVLESGQEAADYILRKGGFAERNVHELPDVILLDLKLPKLTGFEILKLIRGNEDTSHIPVIVFTASNIQTDIMAGYKIGANSMVTKPIEALKFMECVRVLGSYWLLWNHPPPAA